MLDKWITAGILTAQLFFLSNGAHAGQPADLHSAKELKADLQELAERIKQDHPRPFRFISEADFDALVAEQSNLIDSNSTKKDAYWAMSRIITSIGCGHSRPFYFNMEDKEIQPAQRFPVEVRMFAERMYVIDPLNSADKVAVGDEITVINGRPIASIMQDILVRIPTDNHLINPKWHEFNASATSYLTYALGFPEHYEVEVAGHNESYTLNALSKFEHKPIRSPNDLCQEDLCYRVDKSRNLGIMTIHSFAFYGERGQQFVDFIAGAFGDLSEQQRAGLLIDVRDNGGGSGLAANWLLRRIAHKPYQYWSTTSDPRGQEELFEIQKPVATGFTGPTTILMNANTFSVVPHFLAIAKEHRIATLVGTPAGGTKSSNDGKRQYSATNTGYQYTVARMTFDVDAPSQSADAPVQPDVFIQPTLQDTLMRQDSVLEATLKLMTRTIQLTTNNTELME